MVKEENNKISYALLARKQFLDLLRQLKLNRDFEPEEVSRICDLLQNYDEILYPIIVKELENADDEVLIQKYEYILKFLDYPGFIPHLIELFPKTYEKPALRKAILNVLRHYKFGIRHPLYSQYGRHILERIGKIKQKFLAVRYYDFDELTEAFKEFYLLETDEMTFLMHDFAGNGKVALQTLELFLMTGIHELINETIEEIAKIRDSQSIRILMSAKEYLPIEYHALINDSLKKLKFLCVLEPEKKPLDLHIEKTLMSFPYIAGARYIAFVIKAGDYSHFLFFVIKEHNGLNNYSTSRFYLTDEQLNKLTEYFSNEFSLIEVKPDYAAAILADGIRNNYLNGIAFPPIFPVISRILPKNYLKPRPYDPTTIKTHFEEASKVRTSMEQAERLWDIIRPLNWLADDERFKDIVNKWYMNSNKESSWLDELLIRKTIREIVIPNLYRWKERLLLLSDFLYNTEMNLDFIPCIISVAENLSSNVEEMEELPFLRIFIRESKNIVIANS